MSSNIEHESPEVSALVGSLLTASMSANYDVMDRLYEMERQRRQALEVHIEDALYAFRDAWGGTVRDYEHAVACLRHVPSGDAEVKAAARHHERASA